MVEDPLLIEAVDLGTGHVWSPTECQEELARFSARTFGGQSAIPGTFVYEVAVGKPAAEILRLSREESCGLIVISTHGLTGLRKLFFGSTTERVLRETTRPVLVVPPVDPGPLGLEDATRLIRRILVPVDLSAASLQQIHTARQLADILQVPLILAHVIEPVKTRHAARIHVPTLEADRRAVAEERLAELVATIPRGRRAEALVAYGDPSEELAKIAQDRQAGLIIIGLHSSPVLGPRMGSVTYRLLCLSPTLTLALPVEHSTIGGPAPGR